MDDPFCCGKTLNTYEIRVAIGYFLVLQNSRLSSSQLNATFGLILSDPYELVKFYGLRDTYRHTQTHIHTHTDRGTQAKTWTFGRQFEGVSDIIMVLAGPE